MPLVAFRVEKKNLCGKANSFVSGTVLVGKYQPATNTKFIVQCIGLIKDMFATLHGYEVELLV